MFVLELTCTLTGTAQFCQTIWEIRSCPGLLLRCLSSDKRCISISNHQNYVLHFFTHFSGLACGRRSYHFVWLAGGSWYYHADEGWQQSVRPQSKRNLNTCLRFLLLLPICCSPRVMSGVVHRPFIIGSCSVTFSPCNHYFVGALWKNVKEFTAWKVQEKNEMFFRTLYFSGLPLRGILEGFVEREQAQ